MGFPPSCAYSGRARRDLAARSSGFPRADPPDPPVRTAGADRGDGRSARRPAGAIHLAARAYQVVHAEGPERIAMEWWRDDARPRADARLFPGREQGGCACLALSRRFIHSQTAQQSQWFLHGLFAVRARAEAVAAYAELAVTTNFSFLRGASHPKELVKQAKLLRLTGSASPIATRSPAWCGRTCKRRS